jgi:hypothetical protein
MGIVIIKVNLKDESFKTQDYFAQRRPFFFRIAYGKSVCNVLGTEITPGRMRGLAKGLRQIA